MTNNEILKFVKEKPWCNVSDIMRIANIGRNKALSVKSKIKSELESQGFIVPGNSIPTEAVLKAFNINLDYIKEINK